MKTASLLHELEYNEKRPAVRVLLETDSSKEIRIALKKDQVFKEHKTPFPIVVELFDGNIIFGVGNQKHELVKGDIISLEANIPHDLKGLEDSIIRLTISKMDTAERVEQVAGQS